MDSTAFLENLKAMLWYSGQIVHVEQIPPRESRLGELGPPLSESLNASLEEQGIHSLYSHQVEAITACRMGHNIAVSTAAASGKSLCYNIPVLESLLRDPTSRALYLFPTKALAQDQLRSLESIIPKGSRIKVDVFDGDTPFESRADIKRGSQVVISNPDMLHLGILPNHRSWYRFFRGLRYVIVDEAHVYRGIFGSHVANIIRRLARLAYKYGASPQYICCSATIANPREHSENLVGLPFTLIKDDGSPYGGKDFVIWNPPLIDANSGKRYSTNSETALILRELVLNKIRNLTFVRSRRLAELIFVYVQNQIKAINPELSSQIAPYRGTYLPEDRRQLEHDLFEGRIIALVTTNAMELGVDVGDLAATLLSGYPGSLSSIWQQAGRSGRRGERSLSILVAKDNPLDQYIARHPDALFGKSHENARISIINPYILKPHLLCAAYEAPLTQKDKDRFGYKFEDAIHELLLDGYLKLRSGKWYLSPNVSYPADSFGIRSSSSTTYSLVEFDSGILLETIDEPSVFHQLYPGAVYLHQGQSYLVMDLDLESASVYVKEKEVEYFTEAKDFTDTRIIDTLMSRKADKSIVYWGEVEVSNTVVGFKRKAHFTENVLSEELIDLPIQVFNTMALWFDIPNDITQQMLKDKVDFAGGLHALEHAAIGMLPLFAMCDRNDIGGLSTILHPDTGSPQIFIHDGYLGGVGISEYGYKEVEKLWRATLDLISLCLCESGCPSCIQSPKCGNNNEPLDKSVAISILEGLIH